MEASPPYSSSDRSCGKSTRRQEAQHKGHTKGHTKGRMQNPARLKNKHSRASIEALMEERIPRRGWLPEAYRRSSLWSADVTVLGEAIRAKKGSIVIRAQATAGLAPRCSSACLYTYAHKGASLSE